MLHKVFHLLSLFFLFDLLMWAVNWRTVSLRSLLTPQYAMWYLLSMFYWRLSALFLKRKHLTVKNLLFVGILSALVGFVPFVGEMFSFNRTVCFFVFFFAGMMCRNTDFFKKIDKFPWWWSILPSAMIFLFVLWMYGDGLRYVYSNSYNGSLLRCVERVGWMGFSVVVGVCVIRLSRIKMPSVFARLGRKSLFFYIYHTFFIMLLPYVVLSLNLPCNLLMCIIYTVLIVITLSCLAQLRFLNVLLEFNMFERFSTWLFHKCQRRQLLKG